MFIALVNLRQSLTKSRCGREQSLAAQHWRGMARYFFHVRDGTDFPDHDGIELTSDDEARTQAVIASGEALRDAGNRFWNSGEWEMLVTDITGATICTLKFSGTT